MDSSGQCHSMHATINTKTIRCPPAGFRLDLPHPSVTPPSHRLNYIQSRDSWPAKGEHQVANTKDESSGRSSLSLKDFLPALRDVWQQKIDSMSFTNPSSSRVKWIARAWYLHQHSYHNRRLEQLPPGCRSNRRETSHSRGPCFNGLC